MSTTAAALTWTSTSPAGPAVDLAAEVVGDVEALAAAATAADGTAPLSEQVLRHLRHPGVAHLIAHRDGRSTEEPRPGRRLTEEPPPDRRLTEEPPPDRRLTEEPPPDGVGSSDMLRVGSSDMLRVGSSGTPRVLIGYAQLDAAATTPDGAADPVAELVVHPAHRRTGVGSALLAALLEQAPMLRVWAHGGHPGAAALAARFGLTADRELWRLHRSLREPFADPVLPDGVALRPFGVGVDEPELLRVNNAAFAWHPEQGGWTSAEIAEREAEPWFDAAGVLLAVDVADPAHVLGFHWTKVHPAGADGPLGEVYVLAVDPAARGRRLGPALTLAGLRHLRDRGLAEVMLYVEADNTAAVRVYRDLGFTPWGSDVSYRR